MDTTVSMERLLKTAVDTVEVVFERVGQILTENGRDAKSFKLQYLGYKSYNAPCNLLLQRSGWSNDKKYLKQFLSQLKASHGWGEEAIEVALQHCNRMIEQDKDKISGIILVGGAPPTPTKEQVEQLRAVKEKEHHFSKDEYVAKTAYYKHEIEKLKQHGVVVDTYYLDDKAKVAFEWMAQKTDGRCQSLDIAACYGAEMLCGIISKRILNGCG